VIHSALGELHVTEPTWKKYLTDYNEGLGLVYERFALNDFLLDLKGRHGFANALEAPLFGMAGVSGINSVALARIRTPVTLLDDNAERLEGVRRIWGELGLPAQFGLVDDWSHLPFPDNTFEFVWNWAAIWHLKDPAALLSELVRVSNKLVFVATPNPVQIGYQVRKHLVEPEFVKEIDERWTSIKLIRETLEGLGITILEQGVLDTPPWPDTVMPASQLLRKLGIRSKKLDDKFTGEGWKWSTMDYYLGNDYSLYPRVMKYARLEKWRLPWQLKQVWSHHRWVLGKKTI
jgi:SAM-dependent methyltransferase